MKWAAPVLILGLTACATAPVTTRTVDRPLPVPCVRAAELPALPPAAVLPAGADLEQRAAWVALRMSQWRAYAMSLRVLLIRCSSGTGS